ncbi:MAG: CDP-diacylglycerol--glycerol-3-phosphate 3-phosphatidyltransferase [Clostridia bacterium]|nr:CDP-diacylglycerol--glycerol-3-phosphate 3-phosphatidyltransferase [Clostridia bacterium]
MNLPNKLTLVRIALIPVCLLFWAIGWHIPSAAVFALAAITDFLDGYLARKNGIVTTFGKFADPVADKMLVLTAMIFLCADGLLPHWAVAIVAVRELMVDGLRMVASQKGVVIAAGWLGKIKTNLQLFCILSAMVLGKIWVTDVLMYAMAAMTLASGVQYFMNSWQMIMEDK